MRTIELFNFIRERHSIYEKKAAGLPSPWTADEILRRYRFCNVYRELDTQTIWFAENWRTPHETDEDLWFASLVFRFVNWHKTAEEIGYPVPWNPKHFMKTLRTRGERREKVYSGAYMISTHGVRLPKYQYLTESLHNIWKLREEVRYQPHGANGGSLDYFHKKLMECFDVGSFLAAQVIADCKYTRRMDMAKDWHTFAASGPGSRRGMNRIMGNRIKQPWTEEAWRAQHKLLHHTIKPLVEKAGMPFIHAQDLQNCLCEFDKYERVRLGEGKPKSIYRGA